MFNPIFGPAIVTVRPGPITGSGKAKITQKILCIDGDEKTVIVPGCPYITASHPIPGVGTLLIDTLAANQKAKRVKSKTKPVLLKGGTFKAKFQVTAPAQQPTPGGPVPDGTPQYSGTGTFVTTNVRVKGT